jgi:hypothetical protein
MHDCQPPTPQVLGVEMGGKKKFYLCLYEYLPFIKFLNINFWMEKKCKLVHNLVECNMSCGKMYVVDPTIVSFLKFFIQKLKLPFIFKDKPFISYSLSIGVQSNLVQKI